MTPAPRAFLPLKDLVFRALVALSEGERHGWALGQALEPSPGGTPVLPGHLYRTLDRMLADGLIEERSRPATPQGPRNSPGVAPSRFFRLSPLGRAVMRAEADRLEALIARSRSARLLRERR